MAPANGDFLDFSGKVVLIIGAATGIGRAVTGQALVVDGGQMIRGLVPVENEVHAGKA